MRSSICCVKCGSDALPAKITHRTQIKHENTLHDVTVRNLDVYRCDKCGETYFNGNSCKQINNALRAKLRLMQPWEIKGRREAFSLTQEALAQRLGIASETISRWESDLMIQSRSSDLMLRLFFDVPECHAALAKMTREPKETP